MQRPVRVVVALALLAVIVLAWYYNDDLVELITRNREILFGRYSRPGFAARILITLLCGSFAALLLSRIEARRQLIGWSLSATTGVALVAALLVFTSHFLAGTPRYIEKRVAPPADKDVHFSGVVRHRPANRHRELAFIDAPGQARSYPDAPPGYGIVQIQSTTDRYGFRNTNLKAHYPIVAVGDSFTAGLHVSDDQAWPQLLSRKLGTPVYNLGVAGADLRVNLNNFATVGVRFAPQTAIFLIDEGTDFTDAKPWPDAPQSASASLTVRPGRRVENPSVADDLRRLTGTHFEQIGADRPVPDWFSKMGWMPLAIETPRGFSYYSFRPGQLRLLYGTEAALKERPQWQATTAVLEDIDHFTRRRHIRLLFVYVPAKPHVTLAVAGPDRIPALQLHRFLGYVERKLPDAETLEHQVFANLGSQEKLFMNLCRERGYACLSTTAALEAATAAGSQVYYTYTRQLTPDGHRIVARLVADYLQQSTGKATRNNH